VPEANKELENPVLTSAPIDTEMLAAVEEETVTLALVAPVAAPKAVARALSATESVPEPARAMLAAVLALSWPEVEPLRAARVTENKESKQKRVVFIFV